MKKILALALMLGVFMAFAMPAAAMDVKFSGAMYFQGFYIDNPSLLDKKSSYPSDPSWGTANYDSTDRRQNRGAFSAYDGRIRMKTEFKLVEGLSFVTRFDALEREWGSRAWAGLTDSETRNSSGSDRVNSNIEFNQLYMDFKTGIGQFMVGYQDLTNFGTSFLFTPASEAAIRWQLDSGPMTVFAKIAKDKTTYNVQGNGNGGVAATNFIANDADLDRYQVGGIGRFSSGEAGLMLEVVRDATPRRNGALYGAAYASPSGNPGYQSQWGMLNPYAKLKIGNTFYVEAEGYYKFGTLRKYEDWGNAASEPDITMTAYGAFVNARLDLKPIYLGGQFVLMSGDDMNNRDKVTGSVGSLAGMYENYAFNRALIMWNAMYTDMAGPMTGNMKYGTAGYVNPRTGAQYVNNQFMDNVWFYQGYFGVKPMAKLDVKAALSYAYADQKPKMCVGSAGSYCTGGGGTNPGAVTSGTLNQQYVSATYGYELDLTAAYSIYDNLTYTIGAGYLWTGDYFKGYDSNAQVKDNYLIMHQLMLVF